jgi:hypothetical protein
MAFKPDKTLTLVRLKNDKPKEDSSLINYGKKSYKDWRTDIRG